MLARGGPGVNLGAPEGFQAILTDLMGDTGLREQEEKA